MTVRDTLELGLKPDAPYREDNLPEFQQDVEACEIAGEPGESEEQQRQRERCDDVTPVKVNVPGPTR